MGDAGGEADKPYGTTCWGLLGRCAGAEAADAAAALESVCRTYRPAVLAYVRAHAASEPDAEDLTQSFFAHLLAQGLLQRADPARGRFRAFLRTCLQRYLVGERDRRRSLKRGGGFVLVPWDDEQTPHGSVPPSAPLSTSDAGPRRRVLTALGRRSCSTTRWTGCGPSAAPSMVRVTTRRCCPSWAAGRGTTSRKPTGAPPLPWA